MYLLRQLTKQPLQWCLQNRFAPPALSQPAKQITHQPRLHHSSCLALGVPAAGVRPHHHPAELAVGALQPAVPAVCEGWWGTAALPPLHCCLSLLLSLMSSHAWLHADSLGHSLCPPWFTGEPFLLPKHSAEGIWALTQFQKRPQYWKM